MESNLLWPDGATFDMLSIHVATRALTDRLIRQSGAECLCLWPNVWPLKVTSQYQVVACMYVVFAFVFAFPTWI